MRPLRDPEGFEVKSLLLSTSFVGQEVLEIGCGECWLTRQFAQLAGNVFGVDPGFQDLQIAATSQPTAVTNVRLTASMGEALPFSSRTFDITVYSNSL
jgi:ubiquinone/menaquinone biosynthesis C-methylase UbiE